VIRMGRGLYLTGMAVLFALLFCTGSSASAEWTHAGGTHKYDGYVDMTTITPTGEKVTL